MLYISEERRAKQVKKYRGMFEIQSFENMKNVGRTGLGNDSVINGIEPRVQRSKCPLSECHTFAFGEWKTSQYLVKMSSGNFHIFLFKPATEARPSLYNPHRVWAL